MRLNDIFEQVLQAPNTIKQIAIRQPYFWKDIHYGSQCIDDETPTDAGLFQTSI